MTLAVAARAERGKKLKDLRAKGMLPAVFYGPKEEAVSISISQRDFERMLADAGESTIIKLAGIGEEKDVLIHDVAMDPVSGHPIHVDFYAIEKGKKLKVHVAIEYEGEEEAPILKQGGAVLVKVLHEIEVECLPQDLPSHITVNVSAFSEIGASIHVKDLALPAGVVAELDPEEVVAVINAVAEETEEAPEAVDMAAIEVEQKGKKEEEAPAE